MDRQNISSLLIKNGNLKGIASKMHCETLFSTALKWKYYIDEPRHDKTNKVSVRPGKTQISLGIPPVWLESSLFSWWKLVSLATHWVQGEDSVQTGRMPRLIWVFAGRTVTLLVLSCRGSDSVVATCTNAINIWASSWDYGTYHISDQRRLR